MKWTIARKIGCGFAAILTGFLLVASFAKVNSHELGEARNWVDHTFQVIGKCQGTLVAMLDLESSQRAFVLTGDATYLTPYLEAQARVGKAIADLRSLTVDNTQQQERIATLNLQ